MPIPTYDLLIEPRNSQALALALVHLLADDDLRREMSHRARLRSAEYGWDRVAQRVLSYYERLLYERGMNQQSIARRAARPDDRLAPAEAGPRGGR